ncbi:MAG TPA: ATP-binding protein [Trebonia sp.]|jgi:anti-sigma regulatory factor (Ser/Thr protein kinase)
MALDQWFDSGRLPALRNAVQAEAFAVGMPRHRTGEVVLAVHELAANAVRHGGGVGRAQLWVAEGALHCMVSDAGQGSSDGHARPGALAAVRPWLFRPGRGLWLVRGLADQLTAAPGPGGSQVTAVFALPGLGATADDH